MVIDWSVKHRLQSGSGLDALCRKGDRIVWACTGRDTGLRVGVTGDIREGYYGPLVGRLLANNAYRANGSLAGRLSSRSSD